MNSSTTLTASLTLLACSLTGSPDDKHLPLAPQVMTARTAYIDNRSGRSAVADETYHEIRKWGRFQVVQDRTQADIILLLTTTLDSDGDAWRHLTVIDPSTGDILWSDSKAAIYHLGRATQFLVGELKKRIEDQSRQSGSADKKR